VNDVRKPAVSSLPALSACPVPAQQQPLSDLALLAGVSNAIASRALSARLGDGAHAEAFLRDGVACHVDAALVFSDFADAATVRGMFRNNAVLMLNGRSAPRMRWRWRCLRRIAGISPGICRSGSGCTALTTCR
jgi:hypothetical protein